MQRTTRHRRLSRAMATALMALIALPAALAVLARPAEAKPYVPPGDGIYAGVSDTGQRSDYLEFTEAVGAHVPVLQSFEAWGARPEEAEKFWGLTRTRGMLSISTAPCYLCEEVISPREIRRGLNDAYLIRMNLRLAAWDRPTYIRLLPEMNGHWNPYSAFEADGTSRGPSHSTAQFRKAWRRTVLIIRGGRTKAINQRLRRSGMPPINLRNIDPGRRLPRTKASFLWVPQTAGSPNIRANRPAAYWPGSRYVDWVGADIYGQFPNFAGLGSFYRQFRDKPFVIGEWSPWDADDPRFVRHLHRWVERHGRARMMVYFQGFGEGNPFEIQRYPASEQALAGELQGERYLPYTPENRPRRGG